MFYNNPKTSGGGEETEAAVGTRTTLGAPSRVIIESAYVQSTYQEGDFAYIRDTNSFWQAWTDPGSVTPGAVVLVLIAEFGGFAPAGAPDLLVVVGESPKYTLSTQQRTVLFSASNTPATAGVALANSLGGATVLVLPGTYDHSALGPQTVPAGVDIVGMTEDPDEVLVVGAISFAGASSAANARFTNPSTTDGYTLIIGAGLGTAVDFQGTNLYVEASPYAGGPNISPAILFNGVGGGVVELTRVKAFKTDGDDSRTALYFSAPVDRLTLRAVVVDGLEDAITHSGISLQTIGFALTDEVEIDSDCIFRGRMELGGGSVQFAGDLRTYLDANARVPVRLTPDFVTGLNRLYVSPAARIRHNSPNAVFEGTNGLPPGNAIISWTTLAVRSDSVTPTANICGNYCRAAQTRAEGLYSQIQSGVTFFVDTDGAVPGTMLCETDVLVLGSGVTVTPTIQIFDGSRTSEGRAVEVANLTAQVVTLSIGVGQGTFNQGASTYAIPAGTRVRLRWVSDGTLTLGTWVVTGMASGAATQQIKYIVAPAWLGLAGSYPTASGASGAIAAAVADGASPAQPADIFFMPSITGGYIEDFSTATGTPIPSGVHFVGWNGDRGSVVLTMATRAEISGTAGRVSAYNLTMNATGGVGVLLIPAVSHAITLRNCDLGSVSANEPTIAVAGAGAGGTLDLRQSRVNNADLASEAVNLASSSVQLITDADTEIRSLSDGSLAYALRMSEATAPNTVGPCKVFGHVLSPGLAGYVIERMSIEGASSNALFQTTPGSVGQIDGFLSIRNSAGPSIGSAGAATLNVRNGTLDVNGAVAAAVVVNITGPQGRCRYIQRITINAAIAYPVNYGVDAVFVDAQVPGGSVDLNPAETLPDGWELCVVSAPSTATYAAATTYSFILNAGTSTINNSTTEPVGFQDCFDMIVDRVENRYRHAP